MTSLVVKMLTSKVMLNVAEAVVLKLLEELAKRSDNTLDDEIVKAVKGALK